MILYVPGWLQHYYVAEDDHEVAFESESSVLFLPSARIAGQQHLILLTTLQPKPKPKHS